MPKYWPNALDLEAELNDYKKAFAKASGYGKWMYSRRVGEYQQFLTDFRKGIHYVIAGLEMTKSVCNCALIVPAADAENFWFFEGHRDITGEIAKTFFFHLQEDGERKLMLRCQDCQIFQEAEKPHTCNN